MENFEILEKLGDGAYSVVYKVKRKQERGFHKNGNKIKEQKYCDKNCDEERGKIIDYCFRCNDKIKFSKYQVITDYQLCGGISSDHYPIYIEGYFI